MMSPVNGDHCNLEKNRNLVQDDISNVSSEEREGDGLPRQRKQARMTA